MATAALTCYVAECFWAGLREEHLGEVGRRIEASVGRVVGDGGPVRYLGWLLVLDDEVVLLLFEGPRGTVQRVAEHAALPFGRILQVTLSPWPSNPAADEEAMQ
jgi:hypothetical protein